jgi:hypothetical protein
MRMLTTPTFNFSFMHLPLKIIIFQELGSMNVTQTARGYLMTPPDMAPLNVAAGNRGAVGV